jgi:hypothetical protein
VIAGVSLPIRREVVVESGASIDGSLYGDLPALDGGAETTDIAEALVSEPERRPQHRKAQVPGSVLNALISVSIAVVRPLSERGAVSIEPR